MTIQLNAAATPLFILLGTLTELTRVLLTLHSGGTFNRGLLALKKVFIFIFGVVI